MSSLRMLVMLVACLAAALPARAQNWSFDARSIAMGAVNGKENLAARMVDEQRDYRSIVLPFGLIQVLRDLDRLRPDRDEFDLVRAIEYAAAPLHYVFGRDDDSASGRDLLVDIRAATLSRDLSDYRGFNLSNQPVAEGLAAPTWGGTIRVAGDRDGPFHGVFVGAGPYFSMRTAASIDQNVVDILASETPLRFPNDRMLLGSSTAGQFALAITGGYRGRFAAGTGSGRDGIYAAVDYNYLHGFRYEDVLASLILDTDAGGLLTINPFVPPPLSVTRTSAESGRGFAIDLGLSAVIEGWEAGFAVNGLANRIEWHDAELTAYTLGNLFTGDSDFIEGVPVPVGDVRVELPKDYRVHGGYHDDRWSVIAEFGHGFQRESFRAGGEYRLDAVELRAGGVYTRELWQPTGGVGFNFGPRVSLDLAFFGTSANAARERRTAMAVSLRLNRFGSFP